MLLATISYCQTTATCYTLLAHVEGRMCRSSLKFTYLTFVLVSITFDKETHFVMVDLIQCNEYLFQSNNPIKVQSVA